jgi:Outer membrane protein beta-barrel domain
MCKISNLNSMRLLFVVAMLINGSCFSQTFSVRVGGNIAWQMWRQQNRSVSTDKILGPHLGVSVTSLQLKNLAIQMEAGYSILGHGGYSGGGGSVGEDRLKFVSIGLLTKFHPSKEFNILLGPQVSFFVGNKDLLGKDDFAAVMGAEYYFEPQVGIGMRYNLGITNLNERDPDQFIQKSRVIQFSLIFRLPSHQLKDHGF